MAVSTLSMAVVPLMLVAPGRADKTRCTPAFAKAAEKASDMARRSWADLHAQYVKYVKRVGCDDAAIAEGWSDAVGHLLADRWGDLERIRDHATAKCPRGHETLCNEIRLAVERVNEEAHQATGK